MKIESNLQQFRTQKYSDKRQVQNSAIYGNQNLNNKSSNPNFTGWGDLFLRFLDTNQAWGATFVDLGFMVLPRTVTDFTRNTDAGIETFRREGMGNANHAMIGLYGTLAGLLFATGINRLFQLGKNDVKASSIFADSETINLHGQIYNEALKSAKDNANANPLRDYLKETLKNYEALSPDENAKWVKFNSKTIDSVADILESEIRADGKKLSKDSFNQIRSLLVSDSKVENNYRIVAKAGERLHSSRYEIGSIISNMFNLGKVFNKQTVIDAFNAAEESARAAANKAEPIVGNAFLKALKSLNLKRSLLGIGIASAVGISAQPLNMYLTKLKTGNSGFVGGGEEDKSNAFKLKKGLFATLFGAGVLATIGNPKNLLKNLQFKGLSPTINQFKFIYGVTIMSRFFAARNDNELKEASFKDILGFANWLLLGNFVQKLVAQGLDKSLIKRDGKGILNWIQNSALKTRDEILFAHLGEKAFDKNGKALSYQSMVNLADKATKTKLKYIKIAQLAGYLYSGLVLGFGIPKLNIYMTKRRMAKQNANQNQDQANVIAADNMLKPENIKFLRNMNNFTGSEILR